MANTTSVSLMDASKFKINTQHFSPYDLALFVDSLETITRLTCEKEARKEQEKLVKLNILNKKAATLPRLSLSIREDVCSTSEDETDEEQQSRSERKKILRTPNNRNAECDEIYFSADSSRKSSPCRKQLYKNNKGGPSTKSYATDSESEESGVFPIGSSQLDIQMATSSKFLTISNKSRVVKKKETSKLPSVELIACRALDEYETLEMYEQEKQQISETDTAPDHEKSSIFSTLNLNKKRFLHKALRYLTL